MSEDELKKIKIVLAEYMSAKSIFQVLVTLNPRFNFRRYFKGRAFFECKLPIGKEVLQLKMIVGEASYQQAYDIEFDAFMILTDLVWKPEPHLSVKLHDNDNWIELDIIEEDKYSELS